MRAHFKVSLATLVLAATAACTDDPARPTGAGTIEVRAFAVGNAQQNGAGGSVVSSARIDRVLLVLGRVKLEKADNATSDFTDERSRVIALAPNGAATLAIEADAPAGLYKELELAIDKLETGKADESALIQANPGLVNASLLIEGTVTRNGVTTPFTFASDLDIDLEMAFNPPLRIESPARTLLVSLVLDVSGWLRDAGGTLLDPTAASSRSTIEGNVQRSIELFEDPDMNGR